MSKKVCKYCGKPGRSSGLRNGKRIYKNICYSCADAYRRTGAYYNLKKKDRCDFCGFVPIHSCQLAIDHKDGDKKNNRNDNLQTLCHNCHSLKTYLFNEHNRPTT